MCEMKCVWDLVSSTSFTVADATRWLRTVHTRTSSETTIGSMLMKPIPFLCAIARTSNDTSTMIWLILWTSNGRNTFFLRVWIPVLLSIEYSVDINKWRRFKVTLWLWMHDSCATMKIPIVAFNWLGAFEYITLFHRHWSRDEDHRIIG